MPEPHLNPRTTKDLDEIRNKNSFTRNVILYYWNVDKTLNDLSGKFSLEIALGCIVAIGTSSEDRESNVLPTKYYHISLSTNIPDYTVMLSDFCTIAPMLISKSDSITPSLRSNCLLNTGIWKTYSEYTFSTVSLSYKEAGEIFRLRVADKEASTWNHFTTWERTDKHVDSLALSHAKLKAWLLRFYLKIISPPDRDANSQIREERASSVDLFLMTPSICVRDVGLPLHLASSVFDDLLAMRTLATKATLSNDSPAPISGRNNVAKKRYNISAFQAELANQTAIFMQKNMLGVKVLSRKSLHVESASLYEQKLEGISLKLAQDWTFTYGGRFGSATMGFMLQKQQVSKYNMSSGASDGNANPMFTMMSMMPGSGGMPIMKKTSSKLRKALLNSGDVIGHVFSCMSGTLRHRLPHFGFLVIYLRDSRVMPSLLSVQMDGFKSLTKMFSLVAQSVANRIVLVG